MHCKKYFLKLIILFLFVSFSVFSQEDKLQKHYMGVSVGVDPSNVLKMGLKAAFDNEDNDDYEDDDDSDRFGILVLGAYYKYKPFDKFDFDAGYKISFSSLTELSFERKQSTYEYRSGVDHSIYARINYSPVNVFHESNHLYSSLETGIYWNPAQLKIHHNTIESEKIKLRDSKLYYEIKLGYKFCMDSKALGLHVAVNNAAYQEAALQDMNKRGLDYSYNSFMILLGVDYEFGFKRNQSKVKQIKRKRRNREIIEKYEGKSNAY